MAITYDPATDRIVISSDPGSNQTVSFKMRAHIPLQAQIDTNIYVNASAPAGGTGTAALPFQTIQAGVNAALSGYTVRVAAGTYAEQVLITTSGITLVATGSSYGNWLTTINGGQTRQNGIRVTGANNVVIDGFKVYQSLVAGIYLLGPGLDTVEVKNCWTDDTGSSGIACWAVPFGTDPVATAWLGAQNISIHHNKVSRANNIFWGAGGFNEHITCANGIRNLSVYNNDVGNSLNGVNNYTCATGGEGIDIKEGVDLFYVHDNTVHDIEKNAIYLDAGRSNTTAGYTRPGFVSNGHVYNNVVYNSKGHGITVTSEARFTDSAPAVSGRKGGTINGIYIDYNTVYGCFGLGVSIYDYNLLGNATDPGWTTNNVPLADNVQVINNICHGNNTGANAAYAAINQNHNWITGSVYKKNVTTGNYSGLRILAGTAAVNTGNINADPLFTSQTTHDFTLQALSPALDVGGDAVTTPTTDFSGAARVQGSAADCGAFERTATSSSDWAARSTGAGVMWAHNFTNAAELTAFALPNVDTGLRDPNTHLVFDADRNKNVLEFIVPGTVTVNVTGMIALSVSVVRITTATAHGQAIDAKAIFNGLPGQWAAFNDSDGGGGGITEQYKCIAVNGLTFDINTTPTSGLADPGQKNATGYAPYTSGGTATTARANNQSWLRPFSVLAAGSNGLPTGDIGARDGHPVKTWNGNNPNEAYNFVGDYFGHPNYQSSQPTWSGVGSPNLWRGSDFWVQFRGKMGPAARWTPGVPDGKFLTPTVANTTANHEMVIRSVNIPGHLGPTYTGLTGPLQLYTAAGNSVDLVKNKSGGVSSFESGGIYEMTCGYFGGEWHGPCWFWPPDEWVTFLIHMAPGLDGGDGSGAFTNWYNPQPNGTLVQIWVANQSQLGAGYVKIFDDRWGFVYDKDGRNPYGWNALWLAGYMNNAPSPVTFHHRFDEIIFKKGNGGTNPTTDGIPCPTV